MDKKIIVMFTYSSFPFGSATANRIVNLAQTFRDCGYKVIVMCQGKENEKDFDVEKQKYFYKNIEYRSYVQTFPSALKRIYHRNHIIKSLKIHLSNQEFKNISYVYFTYRNYNLLQLLSVKYLLKKKIIIDVMEWHSVSQYKFGYLNLNYWLHNNKIRNIVPLGRNIIAISHYLKEFYEDKNKNTIVIPPQIDLGEKININSKSNNIKLIYAGTIGKKDYMDRVLEGLILLNKEELKNLKFTLIGQSQDELKSIFPKWDKYLEYLGDSLEVVNRLPKEELDKRLKESHYLVLMRPITRYSKAGFPSKVPEALSLGLPVVLNLTSDLDLYINDGVNGHLVKGFNATSFRDTIRKILEINNLKYEELSRNALKTAEKSFYYKNYIEQLTKFLQEGEKKS